MHFKDPISFLQVRSTLLFSKSNEICRGDIIHNLLLGKGLGQLWQLLPLKPARTEPMPVCLGDNWLSLPQVPPFQNITTITTPKTASDLLISLTMTILFS